MYVRRAGGVSNRVGLEFVRMPVAQKDIPTVGGPMGVKAFTFWDAKNSKQRTIEYSRFSTYVPGDIFYTVRDDDYYLSNGVDFLHGTGHNLERIMGPTPSKVRFTVTKDSVFVTPALQFKDYENVYADATRNIALKFMSGDTVSTNANVGNDYKNFTASITGSVSKGIAPFMPVSYMLMATRKNGNEILIDSKETPAYVASTWNTAVLPANSIVFPHSQLVTTLTVTLVAPLPTDIKFFSLYRAAGAGGVGNSFYTLVGRIPFVDGTTTLTFADYGTNDVASTPSIDKEALKGLNEAGTGPTLKAVNNASFYQQRLVLGMDPLGAAGIDAGDMYASKLGGEDQLKSPIIYSDVGAFKFNIPVTDGTPPVAQLAMERLLALTGRGVYIIRGGDQSGVLTPTSVNPLLVSEEGCSSSVEPKMCGRKGYFLNATHTKLMAVEFSADGNVQITEATIFSDHFLNEDIVQIEVLGTGEDTVYLLRRDGKLIRITTSEEGVSGFSLIETGGYIESIYRDRAARPYLANSVDASNNDRLYDVLMCYVIRNGFRTLERMNVREDRYREGEFFADCYKSFGMRLSLFGASGYIKIGAPDSVNPRINIGPTPTDWEAGSIIPIWVSNTNLYLGSVDSDGVIHFFYDDEDGREQSLRFHKQGGTQFATGNVDYSQGFLGYFDSEVPAYLRDALAQGIAGLSQTEINKRQTRWAPAFNVVDLTLSGPHIAGFADPLSIVPASAAVTVMADGDILSSPLNPNRDTLYMERDSGGEVTLTLPDYVTYGYVGMPYISEFETLDLEAGDNRTLTSAKKLLNSVGIGLMETRGGFYGMPGDDVDRMTEVVLREDGNINNKLENKSGHIEVIIPSEWTQAGRVNVKNVDPVPMTLLSIYPKGIAGD